MKNAADGKASKGFKGETDFNLIGKEELMFGNREASKMWGSLENEKNTRK